MGNSYNLAILFDALIDAKLGLPTGLEIDPEGLFAGSEVIEDVEYAMSLWPVEFPEETEAKKDVRTRLSRRISNLAVDTTGADVPARPILGVLRSIIAPRWRLAQAAVGIAFVLVLLQVFQVPVWASLQRFVGYGYAPRAGFVPLEGTMVLPKAIGLDAEGGGVEVAQIVLTHSTLEIWIDSESENPSPSIAEITLPASLSPQQVDGYKPEVSRGRLYSYWRYRGEFVPSAWLELRLEGFETRRIPLQSAMELLAPLQTIRVCDSHDGVSVCAVALMVEPDATCALVEIRLLNEELVNGIPMLVANPILNRSAITIRSADGNRATGILQGAPIGPMKIAGEAGTFLEQLCFPVQAFGGEALVQIPAVDITIPVTSVLRVPVVSHQQGWVELEHGESFDWAGAQIVFEQVRAFHGGTGMTILRVLGRQIGSEQDPIITTFQLDIRGESGVSLSGDGYEPRRPDDARTGTHIIDLWMTNDRVETGPSSVAVRVGYPHLVFRGPFELSLHGIDSNSGD